MQIPPLAPCVCGFAQKDSAAVSQLRHIDAELMARSRAWPSGSMPGASMLPPKRAANSGRLASSAVEIDEIGSGGIETHQIGRLDANGVGFSLA